MDISPINPAIAAGTAALTAIGIIPSSLIGGAAATGTIAGGAIFGGFSGGLAGALNRIADNSLIGLSQQYIYHQTLSFALIPDMIPSNQNFPEEWSVKYSAREELDSRMASITHVGLSTYLS